MQFAQNIFTKKQEELIREYAKYVNAENFPHKLSYNIDNLNDQSTFSLKIGKLEFLTSVCHADIYSEDVVRDRAFYKALFSESQEVDDILVQWAPLMTELYLLPNARLEDEEGKKEILRRLKNTLPHCTALEVLLLNTNKFSRSDLEDVLPKSAVISFPAGEDRTKITK